MNIYEQKLEILRKEIDEIDDLLISCLVKRAEVVMKVGKLKKDHRKPVVDGKRWEKVIEKITKKAQESDLDTSYVCNLYSIIHEHAKELERIL